MKRKQAVVITTMGALVMGLAAGQARAVDDLSLNVDAATECVSSGQTVTVTLDVSATSAAINGVQVRLNYDTTLLTLVSFVPEVVVGPPADGWVEVKESDVAGDITWAAVINGGSITTPHKIATLTFTAIADGTAGVAFRVDNPPFYTKLTRATDNGTILPNKIGSGGVFIGPPDCTITAENAVCDGTSGHVASVLDAGVGSTYVWTVTGGTIDSGQGTTSISYTATDPTSITIDVIVTDPDGCPSSCQKIVTVNANPDCTITAADSVCANSTGNPATVPDAGVGANYVWTVTGGAIEGGQGTNSLTFGAGAGANVTIDVTVTDANGCVSTCQKIIAVAAPDCTITAADAVCDGSTGNAVSVPDAGGGATYTWTVTGGTITAGQGTISMTYTATDPTSVTIDVTVVGGAGCQSSCQKIVTVNANPDCTITAEAAVCDGTSGHVASVPDAGVGATYAWAVTGGTLDSGQGTASISYTATDPTSVTIDVTVTDANSCVSTCQQIVPVNATPDATITTAAAVCDGSTGNAASVPTAGAGATYAWTVTGGTIEDTPPYTSAISYTAGTGPTLTIDVTVTDGNGCISSSQTVVTVNANPDCTITATNQVCDGSTGNVASVPSAGAGSTYAWVVTGGTIEDTPPYTNSISYTATDPTSITIDITVTDGNGCVSSCQKAVTVVTNPTCTITAASAVCDGSTGNSASTVDVGAGATYAWVVTGGTIEDTPPYTNTITYTSGAGPNVVIDLTVTDAGGCVSTCQQIVTVNANPDATITAAAAVCDGSTGNAASVADAGVGSTYAWVVTGGTIEDTPPYTSSISYTATDPTSITIDITITDANGCVSSSQTVVSVNANPDAAITTAAAVCDGSTGNATSVTDAGVGSTYAWVVTGGTIEDTPPYTNSITYTATNPTSITIDVTVTDPNGCVSSSQSVVTVNANPDATITTAAAACDGTTGNAASVADAGVGATYAWTVAGGTIEDTPPYTSSITYTAGAGPTVTIDVTVTDANGCVSSSQTVVTVNANPACTVSAEAAVCAGTAGHAATVSDAGAGASYVWTVTDGTLDSGQGTTSISYTAGAAATVTLDVTVTDANGCVSSCQWVVTVNALPDCTISANDLVCAGFSGNVASVPDAGVGATYLWTVTGGALNTGQGTTSISYTAGTGTTLTIDVTVTDANGCVSTCQKVVTVDAPDCAILGADDVCFESTNNFAFVSDAGAGATYVWTVTGGTLTGGQGSSSITYTAGSGLTVTLDVTITNANGCVSSCQKVVNIIQPSIDVTLQLEAVGAIVTRNVTFVITDCPGTTDTRVMPVTTDVTGVGTVTINSVSSAANWLSVQEGHTLSRLEALTYATCFVATIDLTTAGTSRPLLAGDFQTATVLQDNLCDITDFSVLASRWNQAIDPNLSEGADATGNGLQDTADFTAIQVNFFTVGEAVDACARSDGTVGGDAKDPIVTSDTRLSGRLRPQASLTLDASVLSNTRSADLNGDGVVDTQDIRAFAKKHDLRLLPEFERKLAKLERLKARSGRSR